VRHVARMSPDACSSCVLMWSARDVMMLSRAAVHAVLSLYDLLQTFGKK